MLTTLQTGDIILFSGNCLISHLIKGITWCKWSHVGMIINDDPDHDYPLLYESTHNDSIRGLDLGQYNQGVQIVPFIERIDQYNGNIALRRVTNPCYKYREHLRDYRKTVKGRLFETNRKEILASAFLFSWLRGDKPDTTTLFCSEHQAEIYMALGWLSRDIPSNHFTPKYFAKTNTFLNGVTLGAIELIK